LPIARYNSGYAAVSWRTYRASRRSSAVAPSICPNATLAWLTEPEASRLFPALQNKFKNERAGHSTTVGRGQVAVGVNCCHCHAAQRTLQRSWMLAFLALGQSCNLGRQAGLESRGLGEPRRRRGVLSLETLPRLNREWVRGHRGDGRKSDLVSSVPTARGQAQALSASGPAFVGESDLA
jgi:hypothetical protein